MNLCVKGILLIELFEIKKQADDHKVKFPFVRMDLIQFSFCIQKFVAILRSIKEITISFLIGISNT